VVTQYHSIHARDFLFTFHRNCVSLLYAYRVRDTASYLSKRVKAGFLYSATYMADQKQRASTISEVAVDWQEQLEHFQLFFQSVHASALLQSWRKERSGRSWGKTWRGTTGEQRGTKFGNKINFRLVPKIRVIFWWIKIC